jgi:2'-5' RNA ligase
MSHGVVGLLDRATEERVHTLRRGLEELLGEDGLDALALPHLSLSVCGSLDVDAVASAMRDVAKARRPTSVLAEPWTIFTGFAGPRSCAVVRAVTRTPELDALRQAVADAVEPAMGALNPFTTSATWNPHITLASQRVPVERLGEAVDHLVAAGEPTWTATIERLALIVEEGPGYRLEAAAELPPA